MVGTLSGSLRITTVKDKDGQAIRLVSILQRERMFRSESVPAPGRITETGRLPRIFTRNDAKEQDFVKEPE
jgi:hypothetical protein